MDPDKFEKVEVTATDALWAWFEQNHSQDASIWVVTWKAAHRDKYVSRGEVLDAVIAFGWIDGRRLKLDDDRTMQLLAKRKQQAWAKSYQDRAAALIEEGRMQPSGLSAIEHSKRLGTWDAMKDVDLLMDPPDLLAELQARAALNWWTNAAPSYRRNVLRWIAGAKRTETRANRVIKVATHAARGEKVPQY